MTTNCFTFADLKKKYPHVRESEMKELQKTLEGLKEEYSGSLELYNEAADRTLQGFSYAKLVRAKAELNTIVKHKEVLDHISQKNFQGDPIEGALSVYEVTTRNVKNKYNSIEGVYRTQKVDMQHTFLRKLEEDGLTAMAMKGDLDKGVAEYFDNLSHPDPKYVASPEVEAYSKVIIGTNDMGLTRMQLAGSSMLKKVNYLVNNTIDGSKAIVDEVKWKGHATRAYDWDRILSGDYAKAAKQKRADVSRKMVKGFKLTKKEKIEAAKLTPKGKYLVETGKIDEALKHVEQQYQRQVSRQMKITELSTIEKSDMVAAAIDERYINMQSAVFHNTGYMGGRHRWVFKKGEFYEYNKAWGKDGNLLTGVLHSLDMTAKKIAVTKRLGDDFKKGHELLKQHIRDMYPESATNANLQKIDHALDVFTGVGNVPSKGFGQTMHSVTRGVMQLQGLRHLNFTGITSLNDLANIMVSSMADEGLRMHTFFRPIRNAIASALPSDRAKLTKMINTELDEINREVMDAVGIGHKPGVASKLMDVQMTVNLTKFVTGAMREASARGQMRVLKDLVDENFSTSWSKQTLEAIGITKEDVPILQAARIEAGQEYYTSNILEYAKTSDLKKQDLGMKLDSYYHHKVNSGSPRGGNKEARWQGNHLPQKYLERQVMMLVTQFRNVLMRSGNTYAEMVRAASPEGGLNPIMAAKNGNMNPIKNAATALLFMAAVGYGPRHLKDYAKELVTGKKKKPDNKGAIADIAEYIGSSGGTGVVGDIILTLVAGQGRYGVSVTPAMDHAMKLISLANRERGTALDNAKEAFLLSLPHRNLWAVKAVETYLLDGFNGASSSGGGL